MKVIILKKGFTTKVDDEDYIKLSQHNWSAYKQGRCGKYYAFTTINNKSLPMHKILIDCPKGMQVDHANGDALDNQKHNLRIATHSENGANRAMSKVKKGVQYLGIHQRPNGKFFGDTQKNKIRYRTASYVSLLEAVLERNKLVVKLHGEFAALNILKPNL